MSENANTGYNNAIGWAILGFVIFGLFILLWYFQQDNIRNGVRWLRVGEMQVSSFFVGDDYVIKNEDRPIGKLGAIRDAVKDIKKEDLTSAHMDIIALAALSPLRIFFSAILIFLAFWSYSYGPKCHYRTTLDLGRLIKRQAANFPIISPFVSFNPSNQPPRPPGSPVPAELPPFAEALGPEEWLAYHDIPAPDGKVDANAAARSFMQQLGSPWRGPMHLPPYRQILLAAFCLKSIRKRRECDLMLGDLAKSWSNERGLKLKSSLVREARKILRNRDISGKVLSKCNQHAYENTALLRGLLTAREEGGVLAPSQFLWLRAYDRSLWYPLNNLGRQAFHMEAIGAMCHYKAEKLAQRPIPRPKMEDAVSSISDYMSSDTARPIPPLDYSKSKKRAIKKVRGS
ncbi:MAG: type IV secretion system protein [Alphaproteobacteria bacterium]|nr:type IV secretion system protein [Alphaproteobacteria bacterium]MCB1551582.1 type IV secretion system protein [Alphaproteobacteria bacterium]MCB9984174.1 type IV secretion system protein [Micavibrio sp.]HPQ50663.1 type IV secretion system protein [Alphaproteobacteria bacterium]HRK97021.1 type IV secretion system protein [Alphaproteobacteria bacterium]